jgi:ABC-type metal ion transport system substrate-binding protein
MYLDKINILKQLPDGNVVLIGADRQNGYFILTHLEIKGTNAMKRLLDK